MDEARKSGARGRLLVSDVRSDGVIVETIYQPARAGTALVISSDRELKITSEWNCDGTTYFPVRGSNNLLKHGALLLPSEPAGYETTEALLCEIETYLRKFVALPEYALKLAAAYVLLSWVYDAFNELPYLRFRGDYGTGKTRALLVIGSICYKAFFASGASTISPIFHTLDTFKGTLIFDEADFRFTDEKAELVKILNNGNAKGFPVLRTQVTPNKEFDPRAFAIFGPKIVGMRRSYDDKALESRFLTVEMEPGRAAGVPINLPESQKEDALRLRNQLLTYRLRNRTVIRLNPDLRDPELEPRVNQILLPLLAVVPSEARRRAIVDLARSSQAAIIAERGSSPEGHVLTALTKLSAERIDEPISLAELTEAFTREYGREYDRPVGNRWIGGLLRRLGFTLYKRNGTIVLVQGQTARIEALRRRYGIMDSSERSAE